MLGCHVCKYFSSTYCFTVSRMIPRPVVSCCKDTVRTADRQQHVRVGTCWRYNVHCWFMVYCEDSNRTTNEPHMVMQVGR